MNIQQSLEQKRAAKAWEFVEKISKESDEVKKKYSNLARKASADIQTGGLAQTLAFWAAKSAVADGKQKKAEHIAHEKLLEHVSTWVKSPEGMNLSQDDFLEWLIGKATTSEYRRATAETLAFLVWVKRFAEAKLPQE